MGRRANLSDKEKEENCDGLRAILKSLLDEFDDLTFVTTPEFGDYMHKNDDRTVRKMAFRKVWRRQSLLDTALRRTCAYLRARTK